MDNFTLVRPEHLNHYGFLFGGMMLKWVDELAWLAVSLDFPGCRFVTIAMDNIIFKRSVAVGAILRFNILPAKRGRTSMTYKVDVWSDELGATTETFVFSTGITFVRVDQDGVKTSLPDKPGPLRSELFPSCPASAPGE